MENLGACFWAAFAVVALSPGISFAEGEQGCELSGGFVCFNYSISPGGSLFLDLGQDLGFSTNITRIGCSEGGEPVLQPVKTMLNLKNGSHIAVAGPASKNDVDCCIKLPCTANVTIEYGYPDASIPGGAGKRNVTGTVWNNSPATMDTCTAGYYVIIGLVVILVLLSLIPPKKEKVEAPKKKEYY